MKFTRAALIATVLSAATLQGRSQEKQSREAFLTSQVPELTKSCRERIVAGAKDPDSVKFLDMDTYTLGRGLLRNWITIDVLIMGKNTYGATLRHQMSCDFSCNQKKGGCQLQGIKDNL